MLGFLFSITIVVAVFKPEWPKKPIQWFSGCIHDNTVSGKQILMRNFLYELTINFVIPMFSSKVRNINFWK